MVLIYFTKQWHTCKVIMINFIFLRKVPRHALQNVRQILLHKYLSNSLGMDISNMVLSLVMEEL